MTAKWIAPNAGPERRGQEGWRTLSRTKKLGAFTVALVTSGHGRAVRPEGEQDLAVRGGPAGDRERVGGVRPGQRRAGVPLGLHKRPVDRPADGAGSVMKFRRGSDGSQTVRSVMTTRRSAGTDVRGRSP